MVRSYSPAPENQVLRFPLPITPIRGLRLDPLIAEGQRTIRQIRIIDAHRASRRVVPLALLHAGNRIAAIGIVGAGIAIRTTAKADDPTTLFDAVEVQAIAQLIESSAAGH